MVNIIATDTMATLTTQGAWASAAMYSDFFLRKTNSECLFFNNVLKYILFSEVPQALRKIWMSLKKTL